MFHKSEMNIQYSYLAIHNHLKNTYTVYNYELSEVPFGTVDERVDFILKELNMT